MTKGGCPVGPSGPREKGKKSNTGRGPPAAQGVLGSRQTHNPCKDAVIDKVADALDGEGVLVRRTEKNGERETTTRST